MDRRNLLFIVALTGALFLVNIFFANQRDTHAQETPSVVQEEHVVAKPEVVEHEAPPLQHTDERFYVLENAYQQLVFSSVGGALAEINLPLLSDEDHVSVVREIGFDRDMVEEHPENAFFPDFTFYTPGATATQPVKHEGRTLGGYYPLLRRPLIDNEGDAVTEIPANLYALNVVSKYPELANQVYNVVHFDDHKIVFEAQDGRRTIRKTFELPENPNETPYVLNLTVDVDGDRELTKGLWLTSGVPDVEVMSGRPMNALKYRITRNNKAEVEKMSRPKAGKGVSVSSLHPDWLVNSNGFFGVIMDPLDEIGGGYRAEFIPGSEVPSRLVLIDAEHKRFKADNLSGYSAALPLATGGGTMHFRIYAGPLDSATLKRVDAAFTDPMTGNTPGYIGARSFHGYFSFISRPFSKFLFVVINFFYWLTSSWALSIILLTVVLRLVLYPLAAWGMRSMRRMQQIQPQVQAIQKKHKKNPRKGQIEVMNLYRQEKVNPFFGCLPLLIQMPFLIGMFDLLRSTFALRGVSFIPGWIDNLTAPDVLFSWATPIFFIGTEFHLLPIFLGGVMLLQQRFSSSAPKDKSQWTDQQKQQRTMSNVMVIVFMVMFYNFPSGLCIYFMSSMLLSIAQQWWVNRQLDRQQQSKGNGSPKVVKAFR